MEGKKLFDYVLDTVSDAVKFYPGFKDEPIVTETCPNCDAEVVLLWDVRSLGLHAHCPYCGGGLMLCDMCQHRFDGEYTDDCDWNSKTDSCKFSEQAVAIST